MIGADAAAKEAWEKGFYVSWICLDGSETYQCSLRRREDLPFVQTTKRTLYVRRGKGRTIEAAIRDAMVEQFEDIFG